MSKLLDIQGLRVHFDTLDGPVEALHSVSLSVNEGEIMGVVGESGCGKSVTSLVTIGLATCDVDDGSITFDGDELIQRTPQGTERTLSVLKYFSSFFTLGLILSLFWTFLEPIQGLQISAVMLSAFSVCFVSRRILDAPRSRHEKFMRSIRGNKISMIFQEPMTALNPLYTVEKQVAEVLRQHEKLDAAESSMGLRIGQALFYPATLLSNFVRSDMRAGLQLIGAFMFIFIVHQSGNTDTILDFLILPIKLLMFIIVGFLDVLAFIPSYLGLSGDSIVLMQILEIIGIIVVVMFIPSELVVGAIFFEYAYIGISKTPKFVVWYLVILILLWVPFGVLMTIIGSVVILAIPPIQISGFLRLDPAHTRQVVRILKEVKIPNPEAVVKMYPHELSGGMRQRVMIAMMMACEPKLLIADEPTTALDVTIQAQILNLMKDLRDREGTAIMMITHDLGVIAETCDAVTVMYAGSVVETGSLKQVLGSPRMPYTIGLLHSIPRIKEVGEERVDLPIIPGQVPDPNEKFDGCRFHLRCPFADDLCRTKPPQMQEVAPGHYAACHHTEVTDNLVAAQEAFSSEEFLQSGVNVQ
jgi:oligopeptide/dipeptide ABC transporter ATP-binding protein